MPKERKSPAFAGLASIDRAYNHCAAGENDLVLLSLLDYHTKSPSPCQGGIFTISLVFSACRHRPAPQASLCKGRAPHHSLHCVKGGYGARSEPEGLMAQIMPKYHLACRRR